MLKGKRAESFLSDMLRILTRYDISVAAVNFVDSEGILMSAQIKSGDAKLIRQGRVEQGSSSIIQPPDNSIVTSSGFVNPKKFH